MKTHAYKIARDETIQEVIRTLDAALSYVERDEEDIRRNVFATLKGMREGLPVVVRTLNRIDYLEKVQTEARAEHARSRPSDNAKEYTASAVVETPIGKLGIITWQRTWRGARGERTAWASEYTLNGEPITLDEIRKAGLNQRPTTRNRTK